MVQAKEQRTMKEDRGQTAIEYLLLLAAAVIVAAIVIVFMSRSTDVVNNANDRLNDFLHEV